MHQILLGGFELRDRIANIPRTSLTKIINAAANLEFILEQNKAAKMNNSTLKFSIPTPPMTEFTQHQTVENPNNFNKRKRQFKCKKLWEGAF